MNSKLGKNSIKRIILVLHVFIYTFFIIGMTACNKSNISEKEQMVNFATANNINYTIDPSGIFYQIISEGSGTKPTINSTITVNYTGKLMNGKQFDAGTITYPLNNLIPGWQIAVPMIGVGGEMNVIIPSSLGYGPYGQGSIPGGSPLYFNIKLLGLGAK